MTSGGERSRDVCSLSVAAQLFLETTVVNNREESHLELPAAARPWSSERSPSGYTAKFNISVTVMFQENMTLCKKRFYNRLNPSPPELDEEEEEDLDCSWT